MFELLLLVIVGTAIWVAFDAPERGLSWTWALGVLVLWIVAFPWYLVVRSQSPAEPAPISPRPPTGVWQPDPRDVTRERYREGERWTSLTRPRK